MAAINFKMFYRCCLPCTKPIFHCSQRKSYSRTLGQWLLSFFVLVHTFKLSRKPVHPYHALKSTTAKVQNFCAVDVA